MKFLTGILLASSFTIMLPSLLIAWLSPRYGKTETVSLCFVVFGIFLFVAFLLLMLWGIALDI